MALSNAGQINLILENFGKLFKDTAKVFTSKYYNPKVGRDTLSTSDLLNDLKVDVKDERLVISVYSYYQYIESGRKIGAKQIPLDVIIQWIKKNNITPNKGMSINALAWAIVTSIKKVGIEPRPFLTMAYKASSIEFDKQINGVIDSITNDILIKLTKKS
jgi:hypothetical protein